METVYPQPSKSVKVQATFSELQGKQMGSKKSKWRREMTGGLVVAAQTMQGAEMAQGVALAPETIVQFGEIAMGFDRERVALGGADKTLERQLRVFALAIKQSEPQMNFGVGWYQQGCGLGMADSADQVTLPFQQRGHL